MRQEHKIGDILEKHYYSGHNPHYTFIKVLEVHDEYLLCVKIGTRVVEHEDTQSHWRTTYAPDPNNSISSPFRVKLGTYRFGFDEQDTNVALSWNKFMRHYEPWMTSSINETFTNSWAD